MYLHYRHVYAALRCIKPNMEQQPGIFTQGMVLDQLRNSGVVEAVRVMQELPIGHMTIGHMTIGHMAI